MVCRTDIWWWLLKKQFFHGVKKTSKFVKECIYEKIEWEEVDWRVVYALLVSPFLIIYAPEVWTILFLLACMAYMVYWAMHDGYVMVIE